MIDPLITIKTEQSMPKDVSSGISKPMMMDTSGGYGRGRTLFICSISEVPTPAGIRDKILGWVDH